MNSILTYVFLWSRWERAVWRVRTVVVPRGGKKWQLPPPKKALTPHLPIYEQLILKKIWC